MSDDGEAELRERGEPYGAEPPAAADAMDPVIEAYKRDVDRTLLRENLKLSVEERLRKLEAAAAFVAELRVAGAALRKAPTPARD